MDQLADQSLDAEVARSATPPASPPPISHSASVRMNESSSVTMNEQDDFAAIAAFREAELEAEHNSNNVPQPQEAAGLQTRQLFRSEEYRQLFHLPAEDVLIEDFNCALQEKILLQGHMYLFEHNVCFYSNIFGYEKKKVIPLQDVTCVRKAKTAGLFPNAIEIVSWGKKDFFASFLSRDEAFRLIVEGWSRHSKYARLFLGSQCSLNQGADLSDVLRDPQGFSFSESSFENRDIEETINTSSDFHDEGIVEENSGEVDIVDANDAVTDIHAENGHDPDFVRGFDWEVEEEDAPELPEHYKVIVECKFQIDVQDFFKFLFSNDATGFYKDFHKKCGDEDFQCTEWAKHRHFGFVRDVSFKHPINLYFGPKSTYCQEVQRYHVYRNSHLVIETSQQMNDIPYGDYFRVEGRWDVKRLCESGNYHCFVRISVCVSFSKKTVWKGKIEQGTFDECKEAYSKWILVAHKLLQDKGLVDDKTVNEHMVSEHARPKDPILVVDSFKGKLTRNIGSDKTTLNPFQKYKRKFELEILGKPLNTGGNIKCDTISEKGQSTKMPRMDTSGESVEMKESMPSDSIKAPRDSEQQSRSLRFNMKSLTGIKHDFVTSILAIILITQVGIIMALFRSSQVQYIPMGCSSNFGEEYSRGGLKGSNREYAITWLEQRTHLLREEVAMAESRLQTLQRDLTLIKVHMQVFQKNNPQLDLNSQDFSSSHS